MVKPATDSSDTAAYIANMRRFWNEQEQKAAHAGGLGLNDAERNAVKATVAQADLLGDPQSQIQLLEMFTDRAKRWGREVPHDMLPAVLSQLSLEYNTRKPTKDRMLQTVRNGAPLVPTQPSLAITSWPGSEPSQPLANPVAAVAKPVTSPPTEEETAQFVAGMRERFAQNYTSLKIPPSIGTDVNQIVNATASVAGYQPLTRKNLLATFETMAKHCEKKAPSGDSPEKNRILFKAHMPNIVALLEKEMQQNSHVFKDPTGNILTTVRLGALGPEAKKTYPDMPDSVIQFAATYPDAREFLAGVQKRYEENTTTLSQNLKYFVAQGDIASATVKNPHLGKKERPVVAPSPAAADSEAIDLQSAWGMRISALPESKAEEALTRKDDASGRKK